MAPVNAIHLVCVSWHDLDGTLLGRAEVPQLDGAVTACCQQLVLIGLIEADIECCVRSLHLLEYGDAGHRVNVEH